MSVGWMEITALQAQDFESVKANLQKKKTLDWSDMFYEY